MASRDMQIIPVPPPLKTIIEVYLVQITMGGKLGVILAWDSDDAEMCRKEISSLIGRYIEKEQLKILGPYVVAPDRSSE